MSLSRKNCISCGLLLAFMVAATGCGRKSDAPPQKTTEQIRAEQIAAEEREKEGKRKSAQTEAELKSATAGQIRALVSKCKSDVLTLAKSQNRSPFEVFLVDEYSADIYQAAAHIGGGSVSSDEQMVQKFLKARKAGDQYFAQALNLSYTVMFTHDSFSGPKKEPKRYACFIEPGLTLTTFSY